jgi:alkylhydroperoxidase family enzyme
VTPRIDVPDGPGGPPVQVWNLRPEMTPAITTLIETAYHHSKLPVRERELARIRIAQLNDCRICGDFRARSVVSQPDVDEEMYAGVADWRTNDEYSAREKLAIEYAERFAVDHQAIDDELFIRLRSEFDDSEILDLAICVMAFLGLGRLLAVLNIEPVDGSADA